MLVVTWKPITITFLVSKSSIVYVTVSKNLSFFNTCVNFTCVFISLGYCTTYNRFLERNFKQQKKYVNIFSVVVVSVINTLRHMRTWTFKTQQLIRKNEIESIMMIKAFVVVAVAAFVFFCRCLNAKEKVNVFCDCLSDQPCGYLWPQPQYHMRRWAAWCCPIQCKKKGLKPVRSVCLHFDC